MSNVLMVCANGSSLTSYETTLQGWLTGAGHTVTTSTGPYVNPAGFDVVIITASATTTNQYLTSTVPLVVMQDSAFVPEGLTTATNVTGTSTTWTCADASTPIAGGHAVADTPTVNSVSQTFRSGHSASHQPVGSIQVWAVGGNSTAWAIEQGLTLRDTSLTVAASRRVGFTSAINGTTTSEYQTALLGAVTWAVGTPNTVKSGVDGSVLGEVSAASGQSPSSTDTSTTSDLSTDVLIVDNSATSVLADTSSMTAVLPGHSDGWTVGQVSALAVTPSSTGTSALRDVSSVAILGSNPSTSDSWTLLEASSIAASFDVTAFDVSLMSESSLAIEAGEPHDGIADVTIVTPRGVTTITAGL